MPETVRRRKMPMLMSILYGSAAMGVVIGIVQSPGETFRASLSGLEVWWQYVFPGLVPPLIMAELLAASGLLHGMAIVAEPLARRWFRLPGAAGWAVAFGWTAGVPAGAKETARLRDRGHLSDEDTDTLLLISHVPNPFMVVIIAGVGFLQSPALGWTMAAGVWLGAVLTGILWSRITRSGSPKVPVIPASQPGAWIRRAARAAADARRADGRPLGKQLADGVTHTVATLMTVGGLMMMASVVIRLLQLAFPGSDLWLAVPGMYEMHLGAYESGRSPLFESAPAHAAALLAAAMAWTGVSGLLQARAAFGSGAAFPWGRFITGKLLHSALALLITYPLAGAVLAGTTAYVSEDRTSARETTSAAIPFLWGGWRQLSDVWLAGLASLAMFLLLALLAALIRPKRPRRHDDQPPPSSS